MSEDKDVVADILARIDRAVRGHLGHDMGFEQAVIDTICEPIMAQEEPIRRHWGGERPFIAKRGPLLKAARARVLATVGTKPDREIIRENGINRATMYRWLKKGKDNG